MRGREDVANLPVGTRRSRTYFPELESLRGIAIALVFAFHADGILHFGATASAPQGVWVPLPLALVYAGHTGVSLFFVLSGFLLALPFLASAAGGPPVSVRHFLLRRAWRILPLYWIVVAFAALLTCLGTRSLTPLGAGAAYMLFINSALDFGTALWPVSIPLWSLATEVQFYLALPILTLLGRLPPRRTGLLLFVLWGLVYGAYVLGVLHAGSIAGQLKLRASVLGRSPLFVGGILAAALYVSHGAELRSWLARHRIAAHGGSDAVLLSCLLGLALLLRWSVYAGTEADSHPAWRLAEAAAWTSVLLSLVLAPLWSKPLFVNPLFDSLGRLSYSIYLLHVPLLAFGILGLRALYPGALTAWTPSSAVVLAGLAAAILGCAALSYRWIEQPFLVRKARIDN